MRVRNSIDCVRQCGPGFPGRCTLTLECLDDCRLARASRLDQCDSRFRHRVRKGCGGGRQCWAAARGARRQCLRECRQRRTGSATPAAPPSPRPAARTCDYLATCVVGLVGSCYGECNDRCNGDTQGLRICDRACRDARCAALRDECTPDGGHAGAYRACCRACGTCDTDVLTCETTTSSTTITTTTATTSTTVTTATLPTCTGASGTVCGSCGSGECCANDSGCVHHGAGAVCFISALCSASACTADAQCSTGQACLQTGLGTFCCSTCF